jgi:transglutaminase 1
MDGSMDEAKTDDSVWNFHVWNDAWFARPDLVDPNFSGWQAIDATPQEKSEGLYQCGPCPLYAVKHGLKVDYDWIFIYGEVNADIYQYVATKDGGHKMVSSRTDAVGFNISTKAVGRNQLENVTQLYKFPEGSKEERLSFSQLEAQKELQVSGRLLVEDTKVGDTINVVVRLASHKPTEAGKSSAKIIVTGTIVYYNGKSGDQIFNFTQNVTLPEDGSDADYAITVEPDRYLKYLKQNHEIDFRVFVYSDSDADVDTLLYKRFTFQEEEPKIHIADQVNQKDQGAFKVSFTNPLSIALTKVEFAVEGSGVISKQKSQVLSIPPKETATVSFDLKGAKKPGERVVKAQVSSNELETIYSFKEVKVV